MIDTSARSALFRAFIINKGRILIISCTCACPSITLKLEACKTVTVWPIIGIAETHMVTARIWRTGVRC